jgi:hypothetical protein
MSKLQVQGNASGTGTVTLAAPNTNSDYTVTLPAATGTVLTTATAGVPIGAPAFSAYANAGQSLSVATITKIQLQNELFDTASAFDNTTNYRFTPQVAGYYQLTGTVTLNNNLNNNATLAMLYKNGVSIAISASTATSNAYGAANVSALVYLNGSTDYVELYGYNLSSQGYTIVNTTFGTGDSTLFQGCLVRSAT